MPESVSKIKPWLRSFITAEISAVLEWKEHTLNSSNIKEDPEYGRFNDDGSNLGTKVEPSGSSSEHRIQVVKVVSLKSPTVVLVTDGETEIRAMLRADAVKAYELAIDEEFFAGLSGDILRLEQYGVMVTALGPANAQIQLTVDNLKYERHRHRLPADCSPIHTYPEIREAMDKVIYFAELPFDEYATTSPVVRQSGSKSDEESSSLAKADTVPDNTLSTQVTGLQTQFDLPSQVSKPQRVKRANLTLDVNGIEIQNGVNLAGPIAAGYSKMNRRNASPTDLLSIINSKAPRQPVQSAAKPQPEKTVDNDKPITVEDEQPPAAATQDQQDVVMTEDEPHDSSHASAGYKHQLFVISEDQDLLLSKSSSWVPAAAGSALEHPNLPAALLKAWDDAQAASQDSSLLDNLPQLQPTQAVISQKENSTVESSDDSSDDDSSSSEDEESVQSPAALGAITDKKKDDDDADEDDDDDSDGQLGSSEWSISPSPAKRLDLPPDSSAVVRATPSPQKASSRPSTASSLEQSVPRAASMTVQGQYQISRRAFMQLAQRKKWLEEMYDGTDAKEFNPQEACTKYRAKYINDDVSAEQMRELYSEMVTKNCPRPTRQDGSVAQPKDQVRTRTAEAPTSNVPNPKNNAESDISLGPRAMQEIVNPLCEVQSPVALQTGLQEDQGIKHSDKDRHHISNGDWNKHCKVDQHSRAALDSLALQEEERLVDQGQPLTTIANERERKEVTSMANAVGQYNSTAPSASFPSNNKLLPDRTAQVEGIIQHSDDPSSTFGAAKDYDSDLSATHVPATVLKDKGKQDECINSQQRESRPEKKVVEMAVPSTQFDRFVRAWHDLKPGGAFAKPRSSRPAKDQMDVTRWEFA